MAKAKKATPKAERKRLYGVRLVRKNGTAFLASGGKGVFTTYVRATAQKFLDVLRRDHGIGRERGEKVVRVVVAEDDDG